jgi:hypothetical protein
MTGPELHDDEQMVYLLAIKASMPGQPTDIERLITEIKNLQTALYYTASIIRELDASTLIRREEE